MEGITYMTWLKKHDVITKVVSVIVAVVLWLYVVNATDLSKSYKFRGIAPVFTGEEELMTSKNLTLVGDYAVDIEVSGKRQDIVSLNASDIKVTVDISKITSAGTYELPYTVSLPSAAYTIRDKHPEKLTVKLDEEDVNVVPVRIDTEDLVSEGYVIDQSRVTIIPKELKLTGLQEDVEKISYAQVKLPQKNSKSTISGKMSYEFYDIDGKLIKNSEVTSDYEAIDIFIPILYTKEIPLSLDVQGSDSLKKFVNYSFDPKTILVAGEESILNQLSSIPAGAIKISDISSGMTKKFTLTMPDGILNLSGKVDASAKIEFDGISKKSVKTTLIQVINTYTLPSGYRVKPVTTSLDVVLLGTAEVLEKVNASNVRVIADLQSMVLSRGTHPVPVVVQVDGFSEDEVVKAEEYVIYVEVN